MQMAHMDLAHPNKQQKIVRAGTPLMGENVYYIFMKGSQGFNIALQECERV